MWKPPDCSSVSHPERTRRKHHLKHRAEQGARVSAHYRSNAGTLEPLQTEYGQAQIQSVRGDLTKEDDVTTMFADASKTFGPVQIIIVNHAYYPPEDVPVARMSLDQWNSTISADLTSTFLVVRGYLNGLEGASTAEKDKAAIVMIGSTAGKFGEGGHADYAACKSGESTLETSRKCRGILPAISTAMMYGLNMTLKNEIVKIAPKGRVNCVAPGWVRTPMAASSLENPRVVYQALATYVQCRSSFPLYSKAQITEHP